MHLATTFLMYRQIASKYAINTYVFLNLNLQFYFELYLESLPFIFCLYDEAYIYLIKEIQKIILFLSLRFDILHML